jgi:vitamin K-dependent gamma-carboxylase
LFRRDEIFARGARPKGTRSLAARAESSLPLALFRILLGLSFLNVAVFYLTQGNLEYYFTSPKFHFTYAGLGWIRPLAAGPMRLMFWGMALCALGVLVGFWTRACALLFGLGFTYVLLLDVAYFQNHYYLLCLLAGWTVFLPMDRRLSVRTFLWPSQRRDLVPAWTLWALRAQLGLVYFIGGLQKLNSDWLNGEPIRSILQLRVKAGALPGWFATEPATCLVSYGGLLFDLLILPALLRRKTWVPAVAAAAFFHASNSYLFNIGVFPWFMLGATVLLFPPSIESVIDDKSAMSPWARAALGAYFCLQCLVPFRHLLIPGQTAWHELGYTFSWRMLLNRKEFEARFVVRDPKTFRAWIPEPLDFLNDHQKSRLSNPARVHQFARFLAATWAENGYPGMEVRALLRVGLNGRPQEDTIDSSVDLAADPPAAALPSWAKARLGDLPAKKRLSVSLGLTGKS